MSEREDIVRCAEKYLGVPYKSIYSGTGPEEEHGGGFTCSGLTWRAYHDAGIDIPVAQGIHSYYTHSYNGWDTQAGWVLSNGHYTDDPNQLEIGDLVFYSPAGDMEHTGHVAIYYGDGCVIHANGAPVSVDPLDAGGNFVGGGWPLKRLSVDDPDSEQQEQLRKAVAAVSCLIHIVDRNTWVWKVGDRIHDLTDEEEIETLISVYATENDGKSMPVMQMTDDCYAHLVQSCKAGLPRHLNDLNSKFPPRS